MNTSPLIIICGPTATGKTSFAIELAQKINGELISADSRQIYIGMDIGTGKDLANNSKFNMQNSKFEHVNPKYHIGFYCIDDVPVWLYDVLQPSEIFSAFEWATLAKQVIENIQSRGKIPIIVGGTGFYIQTLIDGIATKVGPNWTLRKQLENKTVKELQKELQTTNLQRFEHMNNSDRNNPRRLIRAIEIAQNNTQLIMNDKQGHTKLNDVKFIGLMCSKQDLFTKIDKRVEQRIKQGIVEEIENLLKNGYHWNRPGMNTLGYKQWKPYFEKSATQTEILNRWKLDERSYAKQQLTWFNRDKRIQWFDITKTNQETIVRHIIDNLIS